MALRIPSGVTDQYAYFVAVDITDLTTRETGLTTFTVYRSRNGGASAVMTTPTINETDTTNMPGVYELLLDEDMTLDAGDHSQAMVFHITQASMAPVTLEIEIFRPDVTAGETLTVGSGIASADVVEWLGTAPATPTVAGVPEVDVTHVGGTVQTAGDLKASLNTIDDFLDTEIATLIGYGAPPTAAVIADAVLDEDMTAHQTLGSLGQAIGDPVADTNTIYKAVVTDATGATVGVDVVAVKAETVLILDDTDDIGVAGAGLTNINLPNQTMDIVGNITGNLSGSVGSLTTNNDKTGYALSSAGVAAIWDALTSGMITVGSIGKKLADWVVGTIDTYTGNTPQTGDSFARLGAPAGASVSADIAVIEGQTDDIGVAGAGLTAVPWNAAWDAEVESEATDALNAYDPPTRAELTTDTNSILNILQGLVLEQGTIGATGNDTTHLHLDGFTYGDDEINGYFLVVFDVSLGIYRVREITDWVLSTELATVATLPFTPEASVDTYWLLHAQAGASGAPTAAQVADAVLDEDMTAHQTLGSLGQAIGDPVANTNTIYKAVVTDTSGSTVGAHTLSISSFVAVILGDTNNIQTRLPAALVGGRMDSSVGAMAANVITAAATAADFLAEINAEVVDVLKTDTTTEPAQGAPTATPTMQEILTYLYVGLRNRVDVDTTAGSKEFYNDAGTVIFKKAMTDDGSIYSEAEAVTGP